MCRFMAWTSGVSWEAHRPREDFGAGTVLGFRRFDSCCSAPPLVKRIDVEVEGLSCWKLSESGSTLMMVGETEKAELELL